MLSPARARLRIDSVSAAWPEASTEGRDAAFERRDALLEHVGRRVHDPGVDVPELLEPEQPRRVRGVVEDVARGGVDRDGPGVRRRVWLLARVEGASLGAEGGRIEFGHVDGSPWSSCGGSLVRRSSWRGPEPWEGVVGVFGGHPSRRSEETKKPQLRLELQPRDLVCGPALSDQVARDLRPHPPHGGAASAYTCSRRLGCGSRSLHIRASGRPASTG